jgi:serine/threonine protein kinase
MIVLYETDATTPQLVEKWIVEVCRGLKAVHQLKVMHRDLKSENIFLTAHDQVKIGDFGLATSAKTSKKVRT